MQGANGILVADNFPIGTSVVRATATDGIDQVTCVFTVSVALPEGEIFEIIIIIIIRLL